MGIEVGVALSFAAFQAGAPVLLTNAILFAGSNLAIIGSLASLAYASTQRGGVPSVQDPGIQQQIRQTSQPWRMVVGKATTSGVLFFAESDPPYTYYGILLAAHQIDGLESIFINNETIIFDEDGFATSTPYRDGDTKYLEISVRNGLMDQQIDPIIARDFPNMPDTFRQRGHATLVLKRLHGVGNNITDKNEDYRRLYGDGQFNPLVRFRGALCYDPRDPSQVLGDQASFNYVYNDTWKWSDNLVIGAARYATHRWNGTGLFDDHRINWEKIALGADECDKWDTDRNGNTFRRYTGNGVIQATEDPYDVLLAIQQAMGGAAIEAREKFYFVAGAYKEPVKTLHQGMMAGGFEYQSERRDEELIRTIKTKFIDPNRDSQTVVGPVREYAGAESTETGETTLDLRFVEGDPRAQRIGEFALRDNRAQRSLTIGVTDEAIKWARHDVINVSLDGLFSRVNGRYRIIGKTNNNTLRGYQLTLTEDDPNRFNFSPSDELDFELDEDTVDA